jgi:proteasome lid subunit RPN8/RPN11
MGSIIAIPKLLQEQIFRNAVRAYPNECCGLLLGEIEGQLKLVRKVWESENVTESGRHNRYCISPLELLKAENFVAKRGWEVLGVYHSHPDHSARPSEFDRTHAILHYSYVILSVIRGRPGESGCWTLGDWDSSFEPEELRITD